MKKQYFGGMPMKARIVAVGLFSIFCSAALAQNREFETQRIANANAGASAALPAIGTPNSELRPAPQVPFSRPAEKSGIKTETAFQTYVSTVTGGSLPVFGKDLFSDVPSTFAPFDVAQVNPDYVIGSGDELQIRGWGMVDIDVTVTVDRSGAVYIPHVGAVKVAGVKYGDLQGHLKKAVSRIFNNFELTASLSQTRTVQIYVVGHAVRPGTYTLSAMSTLLNALFTSGGPDGSGSMRNIQVKRGATTATSFDLYDMLVSGDKSRDVTLRDGDVIFIPEVGPLVAMSGSVKNPGIFELKGNSTLADVVKWAGGFDSAAESKRVIVEKNVNNIYQTVVELQAERDLMTSKLAAVPVRATEVLRVFSPESVPVQARINNEYVRVSGEVKQSGVFQLRPGETLRELMLRLGGATDFGYVYATRLTRDSLKRTQQVKLDEIADRFERDLNAAATKYSYTDRENSALLIAEVERQKVQVQKMRAVKAQGRIVLELSGGDAQIKNLPDFVLQDGDTVEVPRKSGTVDVFGSVFQENTFIYKSNRRVHDYLSMAGGLTENADKSEMYLIRADGTAESGRNARWLSGLGAMSMNPGDTIVVPVKVPGDSWAQRVKEWTTILYQFGLGAAGLKVLQN